jgi:hypothetical protein
MYCISYLFYHITAEKSYHDFYFIFGFTLLLLE